jgi:hypothetical protein
MTTRRRWSPPSARPTASTRPICSAAARAARRHPRPRPGRAQGKDLPHRPHRLVDVFDIAPRCPPSSCRWWSSAPRSTAASPSRRRSRRTSSAFARGDAPCGPAGRARGGTPARGGRDDDPEFPEERRARSSPPGRLAPGSTRSSSRSSSCATRRRCSCWSRAIARPI